MTDTAQDLCNDILKDLGVYAGDDTPTESDLQDVLRCLNDLLEEWSNDDLAVFRVGEVSHALVASQGSYTIGKDGGEDVDQVRPLAILKGSYLRDSNNYDHPLDVIGARADYNAIGAKSTEADFPREVFYDPAYPSATLYYYPVPSAAYTAYLSVTELLTNFTALDDTVSFPPGYRKALRYNGALAAEYMFQVAMPERYARAAADTKGAISSTNLAGRQRRVTFPAALGRRRGGHLSAVRVQAGDY